MYTAKQEGYAGKDAASLKNRTPFHDMGETFDLAIELSSRVQRLAARLVGEVPEDAAANTVATRCGGVLGATAESASRVRHYIVDAMSALDRIEAQLP